VSTNPVVAYFNGVADVYDEVLPFFADFAQAVVERVAPAPGIQALDLAAGRGALTGKLLACGVSVTAVDAAPRMVERLKIDYPSLPAYVRDAAHLDLPAAAFDLVVCGFAIHLVPDPYAVIEEVLRVLKPGGQLALTVPGRADGAPDPWQDPLVDLYAEYRRFQADGGGRHGNDVLLAELGLAEMSAETLEVAIPVPDGDTYWRWGLSHGAGRFVEGLPPEKRDEMRTRLLARLEEAPGFVLRRSATLWMGRKPGRVVAAGPRNTV